MRRAACLMGHKKCQLPLLDPLAGQVIYINGRPFVVREADKPFANLEYTGIDRERVESMEARLKQDVLLEVRGGAGRRQGGG